LSNAGSHPTSIVVEDDEIKYGVPGYPGVVAVKQEVVRDGRERPALFNV
jgi:hypothetical protein